MTPTHRNSKPTITMNWNNNVHNLKARIAWSQDRAAFNTRTDLKWETVPEGFSVRHFHLKGVAGLYRANLDGQTMVIGKSSESKGNRLYKRLYDFIRPSDSARKRRIGRFIHAHQHDLELQVLKVGKDQVACGLTTLIHRPMIALHKPCVNATEREFKAEIDRKYNFSWICLGRL